MLSATFKAAGDLISPELRAILIRAILMTVLMFALTLLLVEVLVTYLTQFSWPWADWVVGIGTGLLLVVAFFFLMSSVTAAFAGFFLDEVATKVERRHYPEDRPGAAPPAFKAAIMGLRFALLVLLVNLALLPTIFLGVGAVILLVANAYLLSREYFEMVAMRHMAVEDALQMRKRNSPSIFVSGFVPALLSLVPLLNLAVPLFATAYFVHVFKWVQGSSAGTGKDR